MILFYILLFFCNIYPQFFKQKMSIVFSIYTNFFCNLFLMVG